jgi:hypothetical protein
MEKNMSELEQLTKLQRDNNKMSKHITGIQLAVNLLLLRKEDILKKMRTADPAIEQLTHEAFDTVERKLNILSAYALVESSELFKGQWRFRMKDGRRLMTPPYIVDEDAATLMAVEFAKESAEDSIEQ